MKKMSGSPSAGIAGNNGNGYKQMFWHGFDKPATSKSMGSNFMSKGKSNGGPMGKKRVGASGCSCQH